MTPGPLASSSTCVWPGGTRKLSQLLCSSRSPRGSAFGFSFCSPLRRTSPTRIVEVERIERPSWGFAKSSRTAACRGTETTRAKSKLSRNLKFRISTQTLPSVFILYLSSCVEFDFTNFQLALLRFVKSFSVFDADGSVAIRGGQEATEITFNRRLQVKHFLNRIIPCTAQSEQKRIRRHRAGIPVAAFVLVEWIADSSIVTLA